MHPIFFQMGNIVGYSYGLMIGLGALLAIFVSEWRAKRRGLDGELVFSAAVWGLLAGLLGAKLTFIISNIKLLFTCKINKSYSISRNTNCEVCIFFFFRMFHSIFKFINTEYVYVQVVSALIEISIKNCNKFF